MLACVAAAGPLWAQRVFDPPVALERYRHVYLVNPDGTNTQIVESVSRILTTKGAEDYGATDVQYIGSQEEILSVEAWTVTVDGQKVPVPPSAIRDREEDNSGGASEFSDSKLKSIIFPRVSKGSLVAYKATSRVHAAPYPGEFFEAFAFSSRVAVMDWEVTFAIPESRRLYVDMRGVTGGLEKTADGMAHYTFRYRRTTTAAPPAGVAGTIHYADYLFVSTMPDMDSLGRVARTFFEPNVVVTDEIRDLARTLTASARDERDKVRLLYNWVTQNIRYVSVALGRGRLVPNPAAVVLHNRYGDCKDHVVLLESLLAAVGIPSSPALINSGSSHLFSKIGVHYPIDHVITYVPSLDLYLDSTDPFAPFGTLPRGDRDKPVLLTALDKVGRTPRAMAGDNTSRTRVRMTIRDDGSIDGTSRVDMTGDYENDSRRLWFARKARPQEDVVSELLARFNETGTGSTRMPDPADIAKPYWVTARFRLEPLVNMPGRGGLVVPVGLAPGIFVWMANDKPESDSRFPVRCTSRHVEEEYVLVFPSSVTVEAIPAGTLFHKGGVRYESRFKRDGQKVTVRRSLKVQRAGSICSDSENRDWHALYRAIQRDVRSQVIFR